MTSAPMHCSYIPSLRCRPEFTPEGVSFRVWAPKHRQVTLWLKPDDATSEPQSFEMQSQSHGYFTCSPDNATEGMLYGYSLDGGPIRPDPCSVWQAHGVHRMSKLFDATKFAWSDEQWRQVPRSELSFYELHVGTFTPEGTFDAAIERLPDLVDLGVSAIEIMPVSQFPGNRNWGYDGVHLLATQDTYGGPLAFMRFINAAHNAGLAVYLDLVLNHFGPEGNYVGEFGDYYSSRYTTPWGPAFNFDDRFSDPVRQFTLESIWHWIADFRLDGLRLDAVHAMFDISTTHILADIKQTADAAAASNGRKAIVVVESLMNNVRMVSSEEHGGYGLDAEWNEDFHHAWLAYLTGEKHGKYVDFGDVTQLPEVMEKTFYLSGRYSAFRGRQWGGNARGLSGDHFVVGVQNHDHAGNRALGERSGQLLSPAMQRLSASVMLMSPFLPLLFMGEEYGEDRPFLFFCSFQDPQLIENVRSGRKRDYDLAGDIPDPQDPQTFERSILSWQWPSGSFRAGLRQLYKDLLLLRRSCPALKDFVHRQSYLWPSNSDPQILVLQRGSAANVARGKLLALFNLCANCVDYPCTELGSPNILLRSEAEPYMTGRNASVLNEPAGDIITLLPHECVVLDLGRS